MEPTFIVNSGRCGSTMLSTLINRHPDILSVSEFFIFVADLTARRSEAFTRDLLNGPEFWGLIAGVKPRTNILLVGSFEVFQENWNSRNHGNHPTSFDGRS